jgi:hypothetical protein
VRKKGFEQEIRPLDRVQTADEEDDPLRAKREARAESARIALAYSAGRCRQDDVDLAGSGA